MNEEPTARDKYIADLEAKLQKAGKARRFLEGEDGSIVTEWLTQQVNTLVQNLGGRKYLSNADEANYDRGQLAMAQKLLVMLNREAQTNTDIIKESIKAAREDV